MAFKNCSLCTCTILFGATYFEGRPYCSDCKIKVEKLQNVEKARVAYQVALSNLRSSPTEPALREEALKIGRLYASWTRHMGGQTGVTIFDEIALSNDIQAACAAAGTAPGAQQGASTEDRLVRLQSLREKGLISESEFQTKRAQLLDEM